MKSTQSSTAKTLIGRSDSRRFDFLQILCMFAVTLFSIQLTQFSQVIEYVIKSVSIILEISEFIGIIYFKNLNFLVFS